jgi:hypothetical protein
MAGSQLNRQTPNMPAIAQNDWHTGVQQLLHQTNWNRKNMSVEGFFESLGQAFGAVIRFIVEGLSGFLGIFGAAFGGFIDGMSKALGITPSLLGVVVLVIGLLLLYAAVRAFLRGSIIAGLIWLFFGLWLLGGLIS